MLSRAAERIKHSYESQLQCRGGINAEISQNTCQLPTLSSFNRIVAPSVAPSSSAAHLGRRRSR